MCGIVGYIGTRQAADVLLNGLDKLSYRGYDSAGIAVTQPDGRIEIRKKRGKLNSLVALLEQQPVEGYQGIGHTRWATHGEPSDVNAHPQMDSLGNIAVVHNGIIENHVELRKQLIEQGAIFSSETDTEVIAKLLSTMYEGDMLHTLTKVHEILSGNYAIAVLCKQEPGRIFCMRNESPLVIGVGQEECLLASDVPALLSYTKDVIFLQNDEIGILCTKGPSIYRNEMERQDVHSVCIPWEQDIAEKEDFAHFMLKEIHEQPSVLRKATSLKYKLSTSELLPFRAEFAKKISRITIVACGSAYHAGIYGQYVIEKLAKLSTVAQVASEYRYKQPIVMGNEVVIAISQSGETADTLAAIREARKNGAFVLGICNTMESSMTREIGEENMLYTCAGPEFAVASTKTYTAQAEMMIFIATALGKLRETVPKTKMLKLIEALEKLPDQMQSVIEQKESIFQLAKKKRDFKHFFFVGRGLDYAIAMEASLKLKEVSYVFSEAYPAGELKHGPLALLEKGKLVIAFITQKMLMEKALSNVQEIKARGAEVIVVCSCQLLEQVKVCADTILTVPDSDEALIPLLAVVLLQLFAYYVAVERGCDVDQPRNLAKSVTVE